MPPPRDALDHATSVGAPRKGPILAVLLVAAFVVQVDVTIVNVALPTLVTELGASTRDLLWIVDAYNLLFASLVLAAGSLGDRYGRKGALILGLVVFGLSSAAGSFAEDPGQLIAARAAMGVGAALIFPTTLSLITNVFTERGERAKAIGAWGGVTGLGIAIGPMLGGWLLEHFWWGSVFLVFVPVALLAAVLVAVVVPGSRDPEAPRLDLAGLALSTLGLGALVYTIIEAPERGWTEPRTLGGFVLAALVLVVFVAWERRQDQPMLDVGLFRNLRFSAASGSVMVAFFGLAGFIFLVTQYFQFLKGYSPLSTGVRTLPVATCVAIASIAGTQLAVRIGNKVVVAGGLALAGSGFLWISSASTATSYLEIALQMVVLGTGMGLVSAPATEAIMGVVPKEKAGVGSAVNDATRELGATLGVATIGSIFASLYTTSFASSAVADRLPPEALAAAEESVGAAQAVAVEAGRLAGGQAEAAVRAAAEVAFFEGFAVGCTVAGVVLLAGSLFVLRFLPARPVEHSALLEPDEDEQPDGQVPAGAS